MYKGTQAELVKELGCSRTAISKLAKDKDYRIIYKGKGKNKRIDIEKSLKAFIDSGFGKRSNPIKKRNGDKKEKPAKAQKNDTPQEPEDNIQDYIDGKKQVNLGSPRSIINRYKEFQQAEKERIRNETALEKLIDVDEVGERSFNLWRQVRDSIQAIKDRCAIKIRSAETDHEAEQILQDEIHGILTSIVDGYEDLDDISVKKKLVLSLTK